MKHETVSSTNLSSVGYDPHLRTLEVRFRNGSLYQYADVPASVHRGLMKSPSKGSFLDSFVKKAGYKVSRIA
ncbi:KTSC domain-containing protein [Nocardiopsis flavescens]